MQHLLGLQKGTPSSQSSNGLFTCIFIICARFKHSRLRLYVFTRPVDVCRCSAGANASEQATEAAADVIARIQLDLQGSQLAATPLRCECGLLQQLQVLNKALTSVHILLQGQADTIFVPRSTLRASQNRRHPDARLEAWVARSGARITHTGGKHLKSRFGQVTNELHAAAMDGVGLEAMLTHGSTLGALARPCASGLIIPSLTSGGTTWPRARSQSLCLRKGHGRESGSGSEFCKTFACSYSRTCTC
jgi:hypothetical protein